MSDFSTYGGIQRIDDEGTVTGSTRPTQVSCGANDSKGSYTQITASTPFDATGVVITVQTQETNSMAFLVDIAIGAASSEKIIIPNLACGDLQGGGSSGVATYIIPISIPTGTRIAARGQTSTFTSENVEVGVHLLSGNFLSATPLSRVEDCGTETGDTSLTKIDAGASANTKGSYGQLISSTSFDYKWLCVRIAGSDETGGSSDTYWLADIAIGAASSEKVIIPNLYLFCPSFSGVESKTLCLPVSIPSGTRISARCQCNVTTAGDRKLDVAVYGVG